MTRYIKFHSDGEVLRPLEPVDLKPDTTYRVPIEDTPSANTATEPAPRLGEPGSTLRYLASLKLDGPSDLSSRINEFLVEESLDTHEDDLS